MKKILQTILFLLSLTLFYSCGKEKMEDTMMSGRVLEYGTNNPITGAKVYLSNCISEGFFEPTYCVVKDSQVVGSDGRFEFMIEEEFDGGYFADAVATGYKGSRDALIALNIGSQIEEDIVLDPYSWLKIHIHNINPVDASDLISIAGPWSGGSGDDRFYGNTDTMVFRMVRGNRSRELAWRTEINNNVSVDKDTIYIPAHDTIYYEILY